MTMEKFEAKSFKKFAARRQVSYLHNDLRKPLVVSIRTCFTRLTEMNNFLRLFPGSDSNVPLGEGDLFGILVHMVPTAWHESMMTANFESMHHTLLAVVQYFEQLEVIESAKKTRETQKVKEEKSENNEQSKTKPKKNTKKKISKKKRKREEFSSDEDDSKKFCSHCKKNNGPYWKQWSTLNSQKSLRVQKRLESLKKPKRDKSENMEQSKTKPKKNGKKKTSKKKRRREESSSDEDDGIKYLGTE